MIVLNPSQVRFGEWPLDDVLSIVIERAAARAIVEWSDRGPHVAFADVPRQRVSMRIVHRPAILADGAVDGPRPGDSAPLRAIFAPSSSHQSRRRLSATGVVLSVKHDTAPRTASGPDLGEVRRIIELVLVSPDGVQDPVTISDPAAGF